MCARRRGGLLGILGSTLVACGGSGGGSGTSYHNLTFFDAMAAADLDADGYADLAIGNTYADADPQRGRVTILRQDRGNPGQFVTRTDFALVDDGDCYGVVIGDVDRDGRADIVATSRVGRLAGTAPAGRVHVFLQAPDGGGFRPPLVIATQPGAADVAIVDVTGDGRPDLVVGHDSGFDVIEQSGKAAGTFLTPVTQSVDGGASAMGVDDIDLDGRPDVVVGNPSGLRVLLQSNQGSFVAGGTYAPGFAVTHLAVTRFDADAYPDVIAVNGSARADETGLAVLFGQPSQPGTLGSAAAYRAGDTPSGVAVADLDRDGAPDIAVAEGIVGPRNPQLLVFRQAAAHDGQLARALQYPTGVSVFYGLAVADLNGDGLLDVGGYGTGAFYLPQRAGSPLDFATAVTVMQH